MNVQFSVETLAMQPTALCNLNCSYCYLPHRDKNFKMSVDVAKRVAAGLQQYDHIDLVWHGGEPLASGLDHFSRLAMEFECLRKNGQVTHAIQTNGTLITKDWCDLFLAHDMRIGVSLDGPEWANGSRTNRARGETFDQALRGIGLLKASGIAFTTICVVTERTICHAKELYDFFCALGCRSVGFNIEEKQGVYRKSYDSKEAVITFWQNLFVAWRNNPKIEVREIYRALSWMNSVANDSQSDSETALYDLFPCVAYNGDVVLLSPEFMLSEAGQYNSFAVGNVLGEPLENILERGKRRNYVLDFALGLSDCKRTCPYFDYCRGGQASNKFFELGTTHGTETVFCKNTEQRLVEAVLDNLEVEKGGDTSERTS